MRNMRVFLLNLSNNRPQNGEKWGFYGEFMSSCSNLWTPCWWKINTKHAPGSFRACCAAMLEMCEMGWCVRSPTKCVRWGDVWYGWLSVRCPCVWVCVKCEGWLTKWSGPPWLVRAIKFDSKPSVPRWFPIEMVCDCLDNSNWYGRIMDLDQYIGSMNAKDCIYQNPWYDSIYRYIEILFCIEVDGIGSVADSAALKSFIIISFKITTFICKSYPFIDKIIYFCVKIWDMPP